MGNVINKIHYNWHQVTHSETDAGEDFYSAEIGKSDFYGKVVKSITFESEAGDNGRTFYEIKYFDNTCVRIYNANMVFYS